MTLTQRTSAPRGFYILNVLRVCSVISLISTIVAETTTQIKTYNGTMARPRPPVPPPSLIRAKLTGDQAFILVDMVGQNITSAGCIFLIMSECSLAPKYYSRHWPHFARDAPLTGQGLLPSPTNPHFSRSTLTDSGTGAARHGGSVCRRSSAWKPEQVLCH